MGSLQDHKAFCVVRLRPFVIEIPLQGLPNRGRHWEDPWFSSLAVDMDPIIDKIDIVHVQRKNFTGPQTTKTIRQTIA